MMKVVVNERKMVNWCEKHTAELNALKEGVNTVIDRLVIKVTEKRNDTMYFTVTANMAVKHSMYYSADTGYCWTGVTPVGKHESMNVIIQ